MQDRTNIVTLLAKIVAARKRKMGEEEAQTQIPQPDEKKDLQSNQKTCSKQEKD